MCAIRTQAFCVQRVSNVLFSVDANCAGKSRPWRIERRVRRRTPTTWSRFHDFWNFQIAENWVWNWKKMFTESGYSSISNVMSSTSSGRMSTFDPPLEAPGSELSSALQMRIVRQNWELLATYLSSENEAKMSTLKQNVAWVRIVLVSTKSFWTQQMCLDPKEILFEHETEWSTAISARTKAKVCNLWRATAAPKVTTKTSVRASRFDSFLRAKSETCNISHLLFPIKKVSIFSCQSGWMKENSADTTGIVGWWQNQVYHGNDDVVCGDQFGFRVTKLKQNDHTLFSKVQFTTKCHTRSQMCHRTLIRSVLESPDLVAFNDG